MDTSVEVPVSKELWLTRFNKALAALKTSTENEDDVANNLRRLRENPDELMPELSDLLVKDGFPELAYNLLKQLTEESVFYNGPTYMEPRLDKLFQVYWSSTHHSPLFRKAISQTKAIEIFADILSSEKLKKEKDTNNGIVELLHTTLFILHNVSRSPNTRARLREANLEKILLPYCAEGSDLMRMVSIMIYAFISPESEFANMDTKGEIPYFIQCLASAVVNPSHKFVCGMVYFDAEEIAQGVAHIAVSDSNKERLLKCGVLPLLSELLNKGNEVEQTMAGKAVWNLCLSKSVQEAVKEKREQSDVVCDIKVMMDSVSKETQSESVRAIAEAVKWTVSSVEEKETQIAVAKMTKSMSLGFGELRPCTFNELVPVKRGEGKELYVSYSDEDRDTFKQISCKLKEHQFCIRSGRDDNGNLCMEEASITLDSADRVVLFVSDSYKCNPDCRTEIEHIRSCGRPYQVVSIQRCITLDGWLKHVVGDRDFIYVDGTSHEHIQALIETIRK